GEFTLDFPFADNRMAKQAADDGAANEVVGTQSVAAHRGHAARFDAGLIARNIAVVLRIGAGDPADGAHAHSAKVRAGLGRIALKIAVQRAVALRDGQFVAGPRKVVHSDIQIPGVEKFFQAGAENVELGHAFGEMGRKGALLLAEPRNVSIAEHGDTVGIESDDLVHGVGKTLGGLIGQSIDEVHVDAVEAQGARRGDEVAGHLEGLDAVDGRLHLGMKVLNAHAQAVEAEPPQRLEMLAGGDARVHLDADLGAVQNGKAIAGEAEESFQDRKSVWEGSRTADSRSAVIW